MTYLQIFHKIENEILAKRLNAGSDDQVIIYLSEDVYCQLNSELQAISRVGYVDSYDGFVDPQIRFGKCLYIRNARDLKKVESLYEDIRRFISTEFTRFFKVFFKTLEEKSLLFKIKKWVRGK